MATFKNFFTIAFIATFGSLVAATTEGHQEPGNGLRAVQHDRELGALCLLGTCSAKYRYQKRKFLGGWKNKDYYWCVQASAAQVFPDKIGGQFWDNDRIVYKGSVQNKPCSQRDDIGDCKKDDDWLFDLVDTYKC